MEKKTCICCGERVLIARSNCPTCFQRKFLEGDVTWAEQMSVEQRHQVRLALNENLGAEKVAIFRKRMMAEIEEIRYQFWRLQQPEWSSTEMERARSLGILPTLNGQSHDSRMSPSHSNLNPAIAAGAMLSAINSTAIRSNLNHIEDTLNRDGEGSDLLGGIF